MGQTAPKNTVQNRFVAVRKTREQVKKGAWHLQGIVHNILNMRHKARWHALGSEHAQISTRVRLH